MSFIKDTFFGGAEKKAARIQADAGGQAIASSERALAQARADLQPYAQAGAQALNPLTEFVMQGPELDLVKTHGFKQIERSAAAGGKGLRSGNTLLELTEFNNMLNAKNRDQRFRELFNFATMGQNAAAGQATASLQTGQDISETQQGIGNVLAAGVIGGANSTRNSLFSFLDIATGGSLNRFIPGATGRRTDQIIGSR